MKHFLIFISLLGITSPAYPWGAIGHRSAALLAETQFTRQTQRWVKERLGSETLAEVANWADSVRAQGSYPQTVWYHFEKMEDGARFIPHVRNLPEWQKKKGGVVGALLVAVENLKNPRTDPQIRRDSLKFLVHFVGDIHQPLHTGRPEDMGGNKIPVNWFGTESNLHSVWDSGMIVSGHKDILKDETTVEGASRKYAQFLWKTQGGTRIPVQFDPELWLLESLQLRKWAYDPQVQTNPVKYQNQNLPVVDARIFTAGIRLGFLLNQLAAAQDLGSPSKNLWKQLDFILGGLRRVIFFADPTAGWKDEPLSL